jgi:hypothetical protein
VPSALVSRQMGTGGLTCVLPNDSEELATPGKTGTALRAARLAPMVQWFSPGVLLRSAISAGVSSIFGRHADPRALEAFGEPDPIWFDYSAPGRGSQERGFWVDYVADAGDGWNPTYAVARAAASDFKVTSTDSQGESHETYRGRLLVLGGDLVYPVASRKDYEERLVRPYEAALVSEAPHPDVFAIPGNHDWYDSLVAFQRRFCTEERRWLGGWRTRQTRSYFALKLPYRWWLLGTDVQLGSDIDTAQMKYFEQIGELMEADDRVILCTPEPHWTIEATAPPSEGLTQSNLHKLEKVLGNRVRVFLAGDTHHYRRHTLRGKNEKVVRHKITAGGGGAFLHPTHNGAAKLEVLANGDGSERYRCEATYPRPMVTRWLGMQLIWAFLLRNPRFGIITAVLYLVTCATVQAPVGELGFGDLGTVLSVELGYFIDSRPAFLWTLLVCLGTVTFIRSDRAWYRWGAGIIHGLLHLVAAGLVGWFAAHLLHPVASTSWAWLPRALVIFAGGWVVGSIVVGTYLGVSISLFGRHANDAFAALAIQDYKNFVRLNIRPDGTLRIFPIKLHRVARQQRWWRGRQEPGGKHTAPEPKPELIEKWIDVK